MSQDAVTFMVFLGLFVLGCVVACLLTPGPRR